MLKPGMKLDLGGIAKGYASGEAIAVLEAPGDRLAPWSPARATSSSAARPPDATGWTIAVAPLEPDRGPARAGTSLLKDAAVSTSGDAEQFVEIDGVRYSHIVDPKTGLGVVDRCSVTVVAPDGATADGLDTAACVLGPERGMALVEESSRSPLIVRSTPTGIQTFEIDPLSRNPPSPAQVGNTIDPVLNIAMRSFPTQSNCSGERLLTPRSSGPALTAGRHRAGGSLPTPVW